MILRNLVRLAPALLLAFAACSSILEDDSFQRDYLEEGRDMWEEEGGPSYTYMLEMQCFCAPAQQLRPVLVTVVNGQVTRRVYVKDRATDPDVEAPTDLFGQFDTVDDLFAYVDDAIDRDADVLQVNYSDNFGFPEVISVDFTGRTDTDQRAVLISEFALTP